MKEKKTIKGTLIVSSAFLKRNKEYFNRIPVISRKDGKRTKG